MNKLILLFAVVMASFSGFAQNIPFKIQKSELFKDEYKESQIVFSKDDGNNGILIVRSYVGSGVSTKNGFYIEHYDKNLKLIKEFEYETKHILSEKSNVVIGICSFDNQIQIIEIYHDLKQKTYICQANIITEDFKISKKELFRLTKEEVKKVGYFNLESVFNERIGKLWTNDNSGDLNSQIDNSSNFSLSNEFQMPNGNRSDIVMTVNEANNAFVISIDYNAQNSEYLKLYLFDNKLNKKIETEFTRNIKDKKYFFQNIQIDPNGSSIYILGKAYLNNSEKKEGGRYSFEMTKISSEAQKSQFIDTKENFVGSLKSIFHNNQLLCIGFYSEIDDYKYKGISYFKLDTNSLEILKSKYNPFSEQFMFDKYGEEKEKELKYLTFKNYFFTKNNELFFNAQEEYTVTTKRNNRGEIVIYFPYDDIVSAKLNNDGDLVWARNINKRQSHQNSNNENFGSYTATIQEDKPCFFINSGEKIKELKNQRIEFTDIPKNKSNLNLIRVNEKGDFEYEKILDDEENEVPFMVAKGIPLGNSVYFLGKKGSTKQLLKVTL
ncbi:hypothetical protein [Flavobacterium sp. WC2509]|uniref:hypothetical protein n=1 Tax=Flavobacterium sp. WC2509 TaxID=3461406 RepID=UPI0040444D14